MFLRNRDREKHIGGKKRGDILFLLNKFSFPSVKTGAKALTSI